MRKDHHPTATRAYVDRRDRSRQWMGMLAGPPTLAATLLVSLLAAPPAASSAERPNLSGVWEMDVELSEDPREKLEEMRESRRGATGGSGGMRGGGGMRRHGAGGGVGGGMGGDMRARGEELRARMETLVTQLREMKEGGRHMMIDHDDPNLRITYGDGRERMLEIDGEKTEIETAYGAAEVKADWKRGQRLVVRTETETMVISETYELTADRQLLSATMEVAMESTTDTRRMRMPPLTFTWLYHPAPANGENGQS